MSERRGVLVTGASSGIGRASALRLARDGFVVFAGVRQAAAGEALAQEAEGNVVPVLLDVTDPASIGCAIDLVTDEVGDAGLFGLVNNAGVAVAGPIEFLPTSAIREQLEVNVVGLLAVTQAGLPLLRRSRGRIVNVGSISGIVATPLLGPYAASKFALEALSDALRRELATSGVQVALVRPGAIATPLWQKSLRAAERLLEGIPEEAVVLYRPLLERSRRHIDSRSRAGLPADAVARVVQHVLHTRRVRPRYNVGVDAKLVAAAAAIVPDVWFDRYLALTRSGQSSRSRRT